MKNLILFNKLYILLEYVSPSNFQRGSGIQPNANLSINVSKTEFGNKRVIHKLLLLNFNGIKYLNKIYSALKHWING